MEFQRLPNGAWAITRWRIHITSVGRGTGWERGGRQTRAVTDVHESGGEVTQAELVPERGAR